MTTLTPEAMFLLALTIGICFSGTVMVGRLFLPRSQGKRRHPRPAEPVCASRLEEVEAVKVLDRVHELVPGLDLNMMKWQVHP